LTGRGDVGRQGRACAGRQRREGADGQGSGAGRLGDGPDLVAGDGFLLEQGGGELGEGLPVAGSRRW
jgi:hypothetical protein